MNLVSTNVGWKTWTALAFGGGLVAATAGWTWAASTLFNATMRVPRQQADLANTGPIQWSTVRIQGRDGIALEAAFAKPQAHNGRCVMVLHGIADSKASSAGFATLFLANGYAVLAPDSRAHGNSGGEFVTYGLLEKHDVIAWAHWLKANGCDALYGLGESLGGSVLIQASAEEPVFRAGVAECAYADLASIGAYRVQRYGHVDPRLTGVLIRGTMLYGRLRYGLDMADTSAVNAIAQSRTPFLLIHGALDAETPPEHSERLHSAQPSSELWLVPGATHTRARGTDPEQFDRRVLAWFDAH